MFSELFGEVGKWEKIPRRPHLQEQNLLSRPFNYSNLTNNIHEDRKGMLIQQTWDEAGRDSSFSG